MLLPVPPDFSGLYEVCHLVLPPESNSTTRILASADPASPYPSSWFSVTDSTLTLWEEASNRCHCTFPNESSFCDPTLYSFKWRRGVHPSNDISAISLLSNISCIGGDA